MPPTPRAVTRGDDEYLESHPRRAPAHYYESIDYECPRNMAHARRREFSNRRRLASSSTAYVPSATSAKYALTLLVGLVVGVVARFWGMSSESSLLWNPSSSFWCNDFY